MFANALRRDRAQIPECRQPSARSAIPITRPRVSARITTRLSATTACATSARSTLAATRQSSRRCLTKLSYCPDLIDNYRHYSGVTESGRRLDIHVLDRDLVPSGALYRLYRMVRVQAEVARGPEVSLERTGERRALLSLAAERVNVLCPPLVAGVACGPDAIVLVYESIRGAPLLSPCHVLASGPGRLAYVHSAAKTRRALKVFVAFEPPKRKEAPDRRQVERRQPVQQHGRKRRLLG